MKTTCTLAAGMLCSAAFATAVLAQDGDKTPLMNVCFGEQ